MLTSWWSSRKSRVSARRIHPLDTVYIRTNQNPLNSSWDSSIWTNQHSDVSIPKSASLAKREPFLYVSLWIWHILHFPLRISIITPLFTSTIITDIVVINNIISYIINTLNTILDKIKYYLHFSEESWQLCRWYALIAALSLPKLKTISKH